MTASNPGERTTELNNWLTQYGTNSAAVAAVSTSVSPGDANQQKVSLASIMLMLNDEKSVLAGSRPYSAGLKGFPQPK
jgi:hypothetical protein